MATLRMALSVPSIGSASAARDYEIGPVGTRKRDALNRIARLIEGVAGGVRGTGAPSLKLSIDERATAASGTVTCASVSNNDTVTVGGVTFTAKTSGPTGNQFLVGVSDTADAAALAAVINANATTSQYVSASSALGVVTLTAIGPALGVLGNAIILSSSNGSRLAVVAMASGANDSGAKTYTF